MAKKTIINSKDGLVIFAGAGCSMSPPSSLPSWYDLNDAILETLWDRLNEYSITKGFRDKILHAIKKCRKGETFPPDYQAQLMVERAGQHYFELLGAVDSEAYNPVQYFTALLAKEGIVKAVVTTNFDRNFERAFDATGIPFKAYFDEDGFKFLAENEENVIPVIKIHGCCSAPTSMIDTRKQRLKGRSAVLQKALWKLLNKYHVIFGGFSGEDFDEQPNYLGFQDAAAEGKGLTYLLFPGGDMRPGMQNLIEFWGSDKAKVVEFDPALYFQEMVKELVTDYSPFLVDKEKGISIHEKLAVRISDLQPMDALNMLTALTESYGDEKSARFLYDKTWKNRLQEDYEGDGISRFLLNYGRSFVFSFQDRLERAYNAGVNISNSLMGQPPSWLKNYTKNPALQNLTHVKNTSPETVGLIALMQTYMANPILFSKFPEGFAANLPAQPTLLEFADIIYYYSHYVMLYAEFEEGISYVSTAIQSMEEDCDEPRVSRLLSRRALIKFRIKRDEAMVIATSGHEDALRARELAEIYHEPVLLGLAELALATHARITGAFPEALEQIESALQRFSSLERIPQYVECAVEHLKILFLGFTDSTTAKDRLLETVQQVISRVNPYITERVPVFEPEFCYLVGMIFIYHSDAPEEKYLSWFADSVSLAEQYGQKDNAVYFRETCAQLNILEKVEAMIQRGRSQAGSS